VTQDTPRERLLPQITRGVTQVISPIIPVDDAGGAASRSHNTCGWGRASPKPSPFSVCIHPGAGAAAPIEVQLTSARRTTRSTCGIQYPGVGGEGVVSWARAPYAAALSRCGTL